MASHGLRVHSEAFTAYVYSTLDRPLLLAMLPPDAATLHPPPLPDTLQTPAPVVEAAVAVPAQRVKVAGPTVEASALPEQLREQLHRNLRAVEHVRAGASQTSVAQASGRARATLSRLVQRTRHLGPIACVPHGSYRRSTTMPPACQECIRRKYSVNPSLLSEHYSIFRSNLV